MSLDTQVTIHGCRKIVVKKIHYNGNEWIVLEIYQGGEEVPVEAVTLFGTLDIEVVEDDDGVRKVQEPPAIPILADDSNECPF